MVSGEAIYADEDVEHGAGASAVAGGTGDFMGARGQVATTRNDDGSYRHEFTLLED